MPFCALPAPGPNAGDLSQRKAFRSQLPITMKVKCPTCGREIEYDAANPFRPFCSERCKLIDLGAWANDEYLIEGEPGSAATLSEPDLEAAAENAVRRAEKIAAMAERLDSAKTRRRKR